MKNLESLYAELLTYDWFSNVGSPIKLDVRHTRVQSWAEATKWAESEITTWCRIEARNLLGDSVRATSPESFERWNEVATSALPHVESLMPVITSKLPEEFKGRLSKHLQSQLVGAFLEEAFRDVSEVSLVRDQLILYSQGLFPCGWSVENPESFPEKSSLVVY